MLSPLFAALSRFHASNSPLTFAELNLKPTGNHSRQPAGFGPTNILVNKRLHFALEPLPCAFCLGFN